MASVIEDYNKQRLDAVQKQVGEENLAATVISVSDARRIIRGVQSEEGLSPDQKALIQLVREAEKTQIGRDMMEQADVKGVWLCVDNRALPPTKPGEKAQNYHYYNAETNTIAMNFHGGEKPPAPGSNPAPVSISHNTQWVFFHEAGHFYQHKVLGNATPPHNTRSLDQKIWNLSVEAQADMFGDEGMRQYNAAKGKPTPTPTAQQNYDTFMNGIKGDDFHKRYYGVNNSSLNDGNAITATMYRDKFGTIPGVRENFMQGRINDNHSIYQAIVMPDKDMSHTFQLSARNGGLDQEGQLFQPDLINADSKKPGHTLIEASNGMLVDVSRQGNTTEIKVYHKEWLDGVQGYRMVGYQSPEKGRGDISQLQFTQGDMKVKYKVDADFRDGKTEINVYQHSNAPQLAQYGGFGRIGELKVPAQVAQSQAPDTKVPDAKTHDHKTPDRKVAEVSNADLNKVVRDECFKQVQGYCHDKGLYEGRTPKAQEVDGDGGPRSTKAISVLIAEIQNTKEYKDEYTKRYGHPPAPAVDFIAGPATLKAMETLRAQNKLQMPNEVAHALTELSKSGHMQDYYHGPETAEAAQQVLKIARENNLNLEQQVAVAAPAAAPSAPALGR